MPKMTHPDSKQTIEVTKDSVSNYQSQGWSVVASKPKTTSK